MFGILPLCSVSAFVLVSGLSGYRVAYAGLGCNRLQYWLQRAYDEGTPATGRTVRGRDRLTRSRYGKWYLRSADHGVVGEVAQ